MPKLMMMSRPPTRTALVSCLLCALVLVPLACADIDSSAEAENTPPGGFPPIGAPGAITRGEGTSSFAEPFAPFPGQLSPILPSRPAQCPSLAPGVSTFDVAGVGARDVELFFDPQRARSVRGAPLIFFWHDAGATPQQVRTALSPDIVDQIVAQGGVIVAPFPGPAVGPRPWGRLAAPFPDDDLLLGDAIVGCLRDEVGLDPFRIHTLGFGDGAIQSAIFAAERAHFVASAAAFSGGLDGTLSVFDSRPDNRQSSLIFSGGANDIIGTTDFDGASRQWWEDQTLLGRFSAICDHGQGHTIPFGVQDLVLEFFLSHPYGFDPSPWIDQPPSNLPAFCELPR